MKRSSAFVCGIALSLGCGSDPNHPSGQADAARAIDGTTHHYDDAAMHPRSCSGRFSQFPVAAAVSTAIEVVTDGTTIYFATSSELDATPVMGGPVDTIATVATGGFELTSFGDAVFYGAQLTSSAYELHQRVGSVDTVLGSVSSSIPIKLQANATDLYVMGSDSANQQSLWRVSRAGGAGSAPPKVTSVATNSLDPRFELANTFAVWRADSMVQMVAIPGPATATSLGAIDGSLLVSGDRGYAVTEKLVTSHSRMISLDEFTPAMTTVYSVDLTDASGSIFSDASTLFIAVSSISTNNNQGNPSADYLAEIDGPTICNFVPGGPLFQDATTIYGIDDSMLDVITKP